MYRSIVLIFTIFVFSWCTAKDTRDYFGSQLCSSSKKFHCLQIKSSDTWESLWPEASERDLIKRVNRTNMKLKSGMVIAVPNHLSDANIWSVSPFPKKIKPTGKKLIIIDQNKLAWAAFDEHGEQQWWGPISSGKNYCTDVKRNCTTVTGIYYTFDKKGVDCESNTFPVDEGGGAQMPFCMFFYRGYALHGSSEVPGYRDSHGCIRMFSEDAQWLNENFVEVPNKANNFQGTKVIIQEIAGET